MSNPLITDTDQVTQEWLNSVLQINGHLPQGKITAFSKTISRPFESTTVWIKAAYDEKALPLPTAFLLKIVGPNSPAGEKEIQFYSRYASALPRTIIAPCFDSAYDAAQGAYHLLIADLTATHYSIEREAPPTQSEAETMIDTLADLHSFWWDKLPSEVEPIDTGLLNDQPFDFAGFVDFMGERLSLERRKIYERIVTALPTLVRDRIHSGHGQTMVHDDAHPWNFMQPRDHIRDRAVLIDWQQWGRSIGMHDVAKMITLFWYPDHRSKQEQATLRRYCARLSENGISGYSWDHCWQDYRLFTLRNMLVPLWAWQWGHWAPHRWVQMEKSLFAFYDLSCEDILA